MGIRTSDSRRMGRTAIVIGTCLSLANCSSSSKFSRVDPKYGVSSSPRVVAFGEPVPKGGGTYRVGKPYTVAGRMYVPEENSGYREEGMASWYGDAFHGRLTANGEVFDMASLMAAHPTLPIPSYARVTNLSNGKSLIVRVNDRGPYHGNRLIDVSNRAAELLEFKGRGVARVRVEYVGRAPLEGSDDRQLMATLRTDQPAPSPSPVRMASARPFVPEIPEAAAGFETTCISRKCVPTGVKSRRPICLLSTRHLKSRHPAACGRTDVQRRTRAQLAMTMTAAIPCRLPDRLPLTHRSIGAYPANCWKDAGSIEPNFYAA